MKDNSKKAKRILGTNTSTGFYVIGGKKGQTYTLDRPDGYDIHPSFLLLPAA